MNTRNLRRLAQIAGTLLLVALLVGSTVAASAPITSPETITLLLQAPACQLTTDPDGRTTIQAEGCGLAGEPGQPLLPHRIIDVALPPDVAWDSLALTVRDVQTTVVPGTHRLRAAGAVRPLCSADPVATPQLADPEAWRAVESPAVAAIAATGQMRKWCLARVDFYPFQYDAAAGQIRAVTQVTVELRFARTGDDRANAAALADTVLDHVAAQRFANYTTARAWYPPADRPNAATYDYVVITTNRIVAESTNLAGFVAHQQGRGHRVLVVTEDDYNGLAGQAPNGRAEKVRRWLMNHYAAYGLKYVLLIGDPTPGGTGEYALPMKMCWPRHNETQHEPEIKEAPTDYFFADLTGNWDKDGDGYFGEWGDDMGSGGLDLVPEVYVGRMSVYGEHPFAIYILDEILQKTMNYEREANATWRKNILLPLGFLFADIDTSALGEQMWDDYLGAAGFSRWRQYQQGSACGAGADSIYPSEEELRGDYVVRDRWAANDYGLVCWGGHGSYMHTDVGYNDPTHTCYDGTLFSSLYEWIDPLDDEHPAFTYQGSCENGHPEEMNNLQFALLEHGGVATVAATRASWGSHGEAYGDFDGSTTVSGIGYEYVKRLVAGRTAGEALYDAKASMEPDRNEYLMNYFDFNLLGDPAISLSSPTDPTPPTSAAGVPNRYTANTYVPVSWSGTDVGAGIKSYAVQVRVDNGAWTDWRVNTTDTSATYNGQAGHTYRFRSIATDWGNNVETDVPADGDAVVTVVADALAGAVTGNRGAPAFRVQVSASPAALNGPATTDGWGAYELFFAAPGPHDVTVSAPSAATRGDITADDFGSLPPLKNIAVTGRTTATTLVLPPAQEAIVNGHFESGLTGWGYTVPLTLTSQAHTGDQAVQLASTGTLTLTPALWQAATVGTGWGQPTLSLLYQVTGGNPTHDSLWVAVAGPAQTVTITLSLTTTGWTHAWQDVTPLTGQPVTVSLGARLTSGVPLTVTLDEVSLGPGAVGPQHLFLPLVLRQSP